LLIAELFGCGTSTVGDVIRESGKWLAINEDNHAAQLRKNRQPKWPALEQAMTMWLERLLLANQDIDGSAILNKANQFARNLNIVDFKGSEGWLSGLKERVGISQKTKHGESLSAPSQEEIECERLKLHDLLKNWKPEDIFNCDETALYWDQEPIRVLAKNQVKGRKQSKNRVTVLLAVNSTGTEKLLPLLINKSKSPRVLKQLNYRLLPVDYYWNKTAWMQVRREISLLFGTKL
jgi:hypothetical protein